MKGHDGLALKVISLYDLYLNVNLYTVEKVNKIFNYIIIRKKVIQLSSRRREYLVDDVENTPFALLNC